MSLGLFNCRLIQPARDQLFFFAGCLAAPVPVRASSVQSPCDASCSAPTSGRARNASCVFPSQEGFVLVFTGSEAPVGCRRVHPTDSPTNSPEDPPILPIDSAIEPEIEALAKETVQPIGLGHRQRPEQHRVYKPECRCAGSDRQRQRQDRRGGGHLPLHKLAPADDGVRAKRIEPRDEPDVAALFALPQRGAKSSPGFSPVATPLNGFFDVRREFFVDLAGQGIATKYIRDACPQRHISTFLI